MRMFNMRPWHANHVFLNMQISSLWSNGKQETCKWNFHFRCSCIVLFKWFSFSKSENLTSFPKTWNFNPESKKEKNILHQGTDARKLISEKILCAKLLVMKIPDSRLQIVFFSDSPIVNPASRHPKMQTPTPADPGQARPSLPTRGFFSKSCSFEAILRENSKFEQIVCSGPSPLGSKLRWPPWPKSWIRAWATTQVFIPWNCAKKNKITPESVLNWAFCRLPGFKRHGASLNSNFLLVRPTRHWEQTEGKLNIRKGNTRK